MMLKQKEKPFDVHCHLEQKDYDNDRQQVVGKAEKVLSGVITCSAKIEDFDKGLEIRNAYWPFVNLSASCHPIYVKDVNEGIIESFFDKIRQNKDKIISIGETGLDYYWVKDEKLRKKQKWLFNEHIKLALELDKPIVVHSRDAADDTFDIMKQFSNARFLLHCFQYRKKLDVVKQEGWFISIGPSILRSKDVKKIARDMPLNRIMLETDAPWFGFGKRNEPIAVIDVAKKIAEVKKISYEEVVKVTNQNVKEFFGLQH